MRIKDLARKSYEKTHAKLKKYADGISIKDPVARAKYIQFADRLNVDQYKETASYGVGYQAAQQYQEFGLAIEFEPFSFGVIDQDKGKELRLDQQTIEKPIKESSRRLVKAKEQKKREKPSVPGGLVKIPGGSFDMGCVSWNDRNPTHGRNGEAWKSGDCDRRVVRDGSWGLGPKYLRSAYGSESGRVKTNHSEPLRCSRRAA